MDFNDPPRREQRENIVPMINVVFLLLIFFLMTAQIAPPEPFEVTPPESTEGGATEGTLTLYISATNEIAFEDLRGDEALASFAKEPDGLIRVDATLAATDLALILRELGALGVSDIGMIAITP